MRLRLVRSNTMTAEGVGGLGIWRPGHSKKRVGHEILIRMARLVGVVPGPRPRAWDAH